MKISIYFLYAALIPLALNFRSDPVLADSGYPIEHFKHEITGGIDSTAGYVRVNFITETSIVFGLSASYAYSLSRHFQLGVQTSIHKTGAVVDSFRTSVLIPVTYNWGGEDLRSDYFVRLAPGTSIHHSTNFLTLVQFGKRFKILENISWRPTIGLVGEFGNGATRTAVDIVPLVFSIVF